MNTIATLSSKMQEPLRFAVTGLCATAVHFSVLTAGVEWAGLSATLANAIAFCCAVWATYFGQSRWVFRGARPIPERRLAWRRFSRFGVSVLAGFFANILIMHLATQVWGVDYRIAFVICTVLIPILTFLLNKFWVFEAH